MIFFLFFFVVKIFAVFIRVQVACMYILYKPNPHILHEKQNNFFLNIIHSLQLHYKKFKTIEVVTAVTVLK